MRINKKFVDKVKLPSLTASGKASQDFYRDSAIPGFALRVTSGGAKSFIVEMRINGKVKRATLGRYGQITVEQARKEAMQFLGNVATGGNPIAEKKAARVKGVTLIEAFEDYLITRKDLRETTKHDYRRSINGPFLDWQNKALKEITKDDVQLRHSTLGKKSKARANNAMRVLRAIYNHAMSKYEDENGQSVIAFNPVDRLNQVRAWYKITPRQGLIKEHQINDWYQATLLVNNGTMRDYLHLLIFTGLRRSEAARLTWEDIDFKARTLTVNETKNHLVHSLPLSDYLYVLLRRRFEERSSVFVFPGESESGYLVEPRAAMRKVIKISGITFILHDLRRTFITIAEQLDIPGYALKQLLNHKDANDVTAGYIISDVNRLQKPMQKITDFIVARFHIDNKKIVNIKKLN